MSAALLGTDWLRVKAVLEVQQKSHKTAVYSFDLLMLAGNSLRPNFSRSNKGAADQSHIYKELARHCISADVAVRHSLFSRQQPQCHCQITTTSCWQNLTTDALLLAPAVLQGGTDPRLFLTSQRPNLHLIW
jgi:hypothetical protein